MGKARALLDGVCNAYVTDVWTYRPYRGQGIAREMMASILERLPGQHVYLFSDEAVGLYEKLGFKKWGTGLGLVVGTWLEGENEYESAGRR